MISVRLHPGRLVLKGCFPHYRRPLQEIIEFRRAIYTQLVDQRETLPITRKIHLTIHANKHEDGCDLSNIVQAVCQALDGKTLSIDKSDIILVDDSQIACIQAQWINQ